MKLHNIGHACHIIETDKTRLIFDPVFFDLSKTGYELFPRARVFHKAIVSESLSGVFISHSHEDHFCLRSLSLFNRETPIYFFGGTDEEIGALKAIGFKTVVKLKLNRSQKVNDLVVTPIDNVMGETECGFLTQSERFSVLNLVDSFLTEDILKKINRRGPFDLVLYPFQEHHLTRLSGGDFGSSIDFESYSNRIKMAGGLATKLLVPGSCQIQFVDAKWRNLRAFPISHKRFMSDLRVLYPKLRAAELLPGDSVILSGTARPKVVRKNPYSRLLDSRETAYDFQPGCEIVPLADEYPPLKSRKEVEKLIEVLKQDFAPAMSMLKGHPLLRQYFQAGVSFEIAILNSRTSARQKGFESLYFKFDRKGVRRVQRQTTDFKIEIHARVLSRNLNEGAPIVSLSDGVRLSGQFFSLKQETSITLTAETNPLVFFFMMFAVERDRDLAINEAISSS